MQQIRKTFKTKQLIYCKTNKNLKAPKHENIYVATKCANAHVTRLHYIEKMSYLCFVKSNFHEQKNWDQKTLSRSVSCVEDVQTFAYQSHGCEPTDKQYMTGKCKMVTCNKVIYAQRYHYKTHQSQKWLISKFYLIWCAEAVKWINFQHPKYILSLSAFLILSYLLHKQRIAIVGHLDEYLVQWF